MLRRAVACLGVGPLLVLLMAAPASGAELISIPVDRVIFGSAGDEILVGRADVPSEFIGRSCEMTGETVNQESVHIGNDLLIRLGGETRELANFEDERDIRHTFREIAELPPRIDVVVRLGRDGVSSGGFLISIECEAELPATTTSTTTTTLSPTSTTTTTTRSPTSTSTTSPTTTSPTTMSPTTVSPTTTIQVAGPTTSLPSGTTSPVTPPTQLAVTGTSALALAWLGLGLCALGAMFLVQNGRIRSRA